MGVCHCVGNGMGGPCAGCPNASPPWQQPYAQPWPTYPAGIREPLPLEQRLAQIEATLAKIIALLEK